PITWNLPFLACGIEHPRTTIVVFYDLQTRRAPGDELVVVERTQTRNRRGTDSLTDNRADEFAASHETDHLVADQGIGHLDRTNARGGGENLGVCTVDGLRAAATTPVRFDFRRNVQVEITRHTVGTATHDTHHATQFGIHLSEGCRRVGEVDRQGDGLRGRVVLQTVRCETLVNQVRVTVDEVDSLQADHFTHGRGLVVCQFVHTDRTVGLGLAPATAERLGVGRHQNAAVVRTSLPHQVRNLTGQAGLTRI